MAAIIIPRRHITQPQGRVELDYSQSTALGLRYLIAGHARDIVGNATPIVHPPTVAAERGCAVDLGAATGALDYGINISPQNTMQIGCVFALKQLPPPGKSFNLMGSRGKVAPWTAGYLLAVGSSGAMDFYWRTTAGVWRGGGLGFSAQIGRFISFVVSIDFPKIDFFIKGVQSLSTITDGVAIVDGETNPNFGIGGIFYGPDTNTSEALVYQSWVSYSNSSEEAGELSENPWQLFRADPIRIYSLPSGAISLSINSITASNIAQTGARITLGLTR